MFNIFRRQKYITSFKKDEICPIIKANMFGKEVYLMIDTGSDLSYIDKEFIESVGYKGEVKESTPVTGISGQEPTFGRIETIFQIGERNYKLPMVLYPLNDRMIVFNRQSGEPPVGIIGSNFLHVYNIVLNYYKGKLYEYI